jgi:hypothetical protein
MDLTNCFMIIKESLVQKVLMGHCWPDSKHCRGSSEPRTYLFDNRLLSPSSSRDGSRQGCVNRDWESRN